MKPTMALESEPPVRRNSLPAPTSKARSLAGCFQGLLTNCPSFSISTFKADLTNEVGTIVSTNIYYKYLLATFDSGCWLRTSPAAMT